MSSSFALPTLRQTYVAVPSAPNTPGIMVDRADGNGLESPPLTGKSVKSPFLTSLKREKHGDEDGSDHDRDHWPSSPLPPEIVKANLTLKKRIRIMRVCHRIALTLLALTTTVLEAQILQAFFSTRYTIRDSRGPWAKQTSLWPSILLLSTSATTALVGLMVLFSYAKSIRWANNLAMVNASIIITVEVAGFLTWIVVAILYRTGRTGKDLWGWACSPLALNIQPNFEGVVNFEGICQRGETNWALSIASAATNFLSLVVWYFVYRRRKYQKIQMKLLEEENQRVEALQGRP